jgi:hypothetical protein
MTLTTYLHHKRFTYTDNYLAFPPVVVFSALVDTHGDETNHALPNDAAKELRFKDRVIFAFRTMRVLKDVQ